MFTNAHKSSTKSSDVQEIKTETIWTMFDSFIVETIASFFVCSVCVLHWAEPNRPTDDWTIQFLPPLSWAFIMLSIHDRDGWFPDTSSFMTLIQWALGSYSQWDQPLVRIFGQLTGMSLCIALLSVPGVTTRDLTERHESNSASIVVMNLAATFLDHIAAMYIILPLLPFFNSTSNSGNTNTAGSNLSRQRHHQYQLLPNKQSTNAAFSHSIERIALSALVFAGVHWTLWKSFASEMNPLVTFVIAVQRGWQVGTYDEASWIRTGCAIAGQFVGLCFCLLYIITCIPKLHTQKEVF